MSGRRWFWLVAVAVLSVVLGIGGAAAAPPAYERSQQRIVVEGNSSEPHLHFHVQDRAGLFGRAHGLPVSFVDYRGGRDVARGTPVQGEFIQRVVNRGA